MTELIRDTAFGHFLRLLTKGKVLPYEENRDPLVWKRYVHKEKSGNVARHGHTGGEETNGDLDDSSGLQDRDTSPANSSNTRVGSGTHGHNEISGVRIDPEKGRDVNVVHWFGDEDPEVISPFTEPSDMKY
jgi:DHA1 family multidrug resistance protein-like MFS transporter